MLKYLRLCVEDSMHGDYGIRIRIYKHSAKYELLFDSRYRSKNSIKPHNPLPVDNPQRLSEWDALGINTWNDEYFKPFCDGTFWKLTYREEGKKARTITGCNAYPPQWSRFIEWLDALKPKMQFDKEDIVAESSTGKCPWTKDELLEMLLASDLGKMENADEQELFDRWSETEDRLEYIALTMKLFPKVNREKAEKMADELNL